MVKITYKNGIPFIDVNGELIEPAAFRSFRPKPDNISLMKRAGIRLYQLLVSGLPCTIGCPYSLFGGVWKGDGKYDFAPFDKQMQMFLKFAPENAYFNVMMQLDMPKWWGETHSGDSDSYHHLCETSFNEDWRRSAADYLKALISYAEEKYGDRIFGYSIAAGGSNEWFDFSFTDKSFDRSKGAWVTKWRELIGKPDAVPPTMEEVVNGRAIREEDDVYKYLTLGCESVADLICHFAREAQTVLKHEKLFGLFYGYVVLYPQATWCTNAYEAVWRSPDIDMLYSPAEYRHNRDLDGVSSYQYAVDSIRLNGKLYLHEDDHRTELAAFPLENGAILTDGYKNFYDWQQVFRRELANTAVKSSAFWWFDFFGGYYAAPEYETELKLECDVFRELSQGKRESVSEIAVFVDPMSFNCMRDYTWFGHDLAKENINALHRCGAPFEYYNLADITRLDLSRYKLCIFLNCLQIKPELRAFIDEKLTGKTKLWFVGAGSCDGDLDLARTEALTGLSLSSEELDTLHADYNGIDFGFARGVRPMLRATSGEVIARYSDGSTAVARNGENIWSGVAPLPWQAFRDIARDAGVHIYDENGGGLAVCSQFICAYTTLTEDCELTLPEDGEFEEIFTRARYKTENKKLRYHAKSGTTMLFVKK